MLFGKYCLLERVSVGGMAEIFRAKPFNAPESQKHLALKRILPHLAEDDEFVQMFIDEATLTVQLVHPNIVRTYELGRFHNAPYILMEFISGKELLELQRVLRRQKDIMGVAMACYIAREIALGMDYVHAMTDENGDPLNIIHRDISPQNVLVTYGGNVKIIDFGIAKGTFQETRTQVGVLKGKFGYMSPDQVRGQDLDHRSDIFSIGTLLWELLTNRRLFRGENDFETLQMLRDPDVPAPSEYNDAIPPQVDQIVAKILAPDREQRYQTGGEVAAAIGEFLEGQGGFRAADMSAWMAHVFAEDVAKEREKRQQFQHINTPDDVRRLQQAEADADPEASGDTLWDSEIAPQANEDAAQFATEHTIVAAGGFDSYQFAAETEEDVLLIGMDDIIEVVDVAEAAPYDGGGFGSDTVEDMQSPLANRGARALSPAHPLDGQDFGVNDTPREIPNPSQAPAPSSGRLKLIAGATLAVACVLAVVTVIVWQGRDAQDAEAPVVDAAAAAAASNAPLAATLVLSVSPPTGLQIKVDGVDQGSAAPITLLDLAPGEHTVEVSHPSYLPYTQTLELGSGAFKSLYVEMKPRI
ncbi:serine/threonine-protein kinase [Bradymonas sediminis]|uniref:Protein kinase domain-containing protein n=1 Tax=Bradymonas sediminis TaxID=1548548 RepID=A0A2Z4FN18_9DELT|nr:serine/threonine-protein kinase [Bradymonas sediminis]AWV90322.1 hypothetical protein DN745_13685 [Bradymonas sediminis]